jgi:mRNA-degrading endonuclease HigB of HigAB toxin-antitoxin module/antitoxin component HigA of HigAB toxin-antitoxin module
VRVIAPSTIKKWCDQHPRAKERLEAWLSVVEGVKWAHPPAMLKTFPSADPAKVKSGRTVYVFNIRQNEYRLICAVHFNLGKVCTLRFMTHKEYEERRLEKRIMTRSSKRANPLPHGIPGTFDELVRVWIPKAIHDRVEFQNASEIMEAMAGHDLNKDQEDYLETVSILVDEYDHTHNKQPKKASPLVVLQLLVEEHGISGRELGKILGNAAAGGFILRGERHITIEQAKKLGARFSVDPTVFLDL